MKYEDDIIIITTFSAITLSTPAGGDGHRSVTLHVLYSIIYIDYQQAQLREYVTCE